MAISWLQGDDAAVRSHFTEVERVPKALEVTESPLVKAVFYACRAMHASLSGKADGQQNSFCHCERASGHLWSSLNVSGTTSDPSLNHVVQLLTCDLLLSLRTTLWQSRPAPASSWARPTTRQALSWPASSGTWAAFEGWPTVSAQHTARCSCMKQLFD